MFAKWIYLCPKNLYQFIEVSIFCYQKIRSSNNGLSGDIFLMGDSVIEYRMEVLPSVELISK